MPIVITEKNLQILELLASYYVLKRSTIQEILFPHVKSARSVCERLRKLVREGYISVASMEVVLRGSGNSAPVYHPNKKTAETLAAIHDDSSYERVYCKPPSGRLLFHWLEISQLHYIVDLSIENSEAAKLHAWFNEWEPINKNAMRQSDLFSLYSEFDKTSCAPDAGFLVENRTGALKSFYLEADRGNDSLKRIVSKKPGGYNRMFELQRHLKHFPASTVPGFSILFVTTTEHRRDELVKSSAQFDPHRLWKFACRNDINADTFFFGSVWRAADKTAHALITQ
jgi:hypothetical protein